MIPTLLSSILLTLAVILFAIPTAHAASKVEINAKVKATLSTFYEEVKSGKELVNKANGMLVFPEVYKAGIGIGGEYGEGALLIKGKTVDYYSTAASFQLGAQIKSQIILFMTKQALKRFHNSDGWKVGVDGSVAVASLGADGDINTNTAKEPVIGFIFSNKGLMYNLTFEGAKITKLDK